MTTKSMRYDHPAYQARLPHVFPAVAAGANGVSNKFTAFTNLNIFALTATLNTVGAATSSYGAWNGTASTTGINATTIALIKVANTAALGATPVLATSTFGPFVICNYNGTATATQTNTAGFTNSIQLAYNGTATSGVLQAGSNTVNGGFNVNQGDQLYCTFGTDTAAVLGIALEYGVAPLANVTY